MADQNSQSWSIRIKLGTRGLLGSLVTNQNSKFKNSKWRTQYRWRKCKKLVDPDRTRYSRVFRDWRVRILSQNSKFKMADPVWLTKMQKVSRSGWNSVLKSVRSRWLRIWTQNWEIQNGGSKFVHHIRSSISNLKIFHTES